MGVPPTALAQGLNSERIGSVMKLLIFGQNQAYGGGNQAICGWDKALGGRLVHRLKPTVQPTLQILAPIKVDPVQIDFIRVYQRCARYLGLEVTRNSL